MGTGRRLSRRQLLAFGGVGVAALAVGEAAVVALDRGGTGAAHRAAHFVKDPVLSLPPATKPVAPVWPPQPVAQLKSPVFTLHDAWPDAPPSSVALTIDDGPHPLYTPQMLDVLAEFGVPGTFSLIGEQVREWPKLVARIAADGHSLTNHTQTHPLLIAELGEAEAKREMVDAWHAISDAAQVGPALFRSPGGAWSKRLFELSAEYGMTPVDWSVDPRDWTRPGVKHITQTMLTAKPADILLCHDGGGDRSQTIEALRTVIPQLQKRGLEFVPLIQPHRVSEA